MSTSTCSTGSSRRISTPISLGDAGHGAGDGAAAADGVEDAVLVLEEREDGEEAGAAEGRHAEVLGLKAEAEADALVLEVDLEVAVEGAPGREQRQQLEHLGLGEVAPAFEGRLQEGQELCELVAVVGEELVKALRVLGRDGGDGAAPCCSTLGVASSSPPRAEDEAVLRVEPRHGDFACRGRSRRRRRSP